MANCQTAGARACCEGSQKKSEDNWSFTEHRRNIDLLLLLLAGLEFLCQGNCATKVYFKEKGDIWTDAPQVSLVLCVLICSCKYCLIIAVDWTMKSPHSFPHRGYSILIDTHSMWNEEVCPVIGRNNGTTIFIPYQLSNVTLSWVVDSLSNGI